MCSLLWKNRCHSLDKVPASQVLDRTFRVFGCTCRRLGMLPFVIQEDGYTNFKFLSFPMIYLLGYCVTFTVLSLIYVPVYLEFTAEKSLQGNMSTINYISENVFLGSQFSGSVLTILLIPSLAKGITGFWNQLVPIIEELIRLGHRDLFRIPYLRSRLSLFVFIIYINAYAIICWFYLSPSFEELGSKNKFSYYLHAFGYLLFFGLFTVHMIHSLIFLYFVFTLRTCYVGLRRSARISLTEKLEGWKVKEDLSVRHLISIFDKLAHVCNQIGNTYGLYVLFQLVIMMTASLMNVLAALSKFKQRDPITTILSLLAYSVWLIYISESGERLHKVAKSTTIAIREAAFNTSELDDVTLHRVSSLRTPKLTAANFFTINRQLFISTASTFATYCVVMLQFKLNGQA